MRVLAYTSPARGHLYPLVPIMAALAERGHHAAICTLSGELGHLTPLGIEGFAIERELENSQLQDWRERLPHRAMLSTLRTFAERSERDGEDLARAIAGQRPDALVIDVNCWGAAAVAEASGLPWAMYCPYLLPTPSRDAPPYGLGMRPLGGPLGAIRSHVGARMAQRMFDSATLEAVQRVRARNGLPPLKHFMELLAIPPLLLSLTAEGFEYPRSDWAPNVRLVGAINWAPPAPPTPAPVAGAESAEPSEAEAWLAQAADPIVLVTCSTERQRDKKLAHVALQALPAAGMSVIATTAAHDPAEFKAPAGSMAVRFLAHEAVLERAACVVCHGGLGITQKALARGVPAVVVPAGRDQFETAARVEFAQAGVRVSPRRLNGERLLRAVELALTRVEGAQRVSRAYDAAGGAEAAADAIEQVIGATASAGAGASQAATGSS
jgi:UDP:flavonoid glycosyltransferase YjiC (YdhE family)